MPLDEVRQRLVLCPNPGWGYRLRRGLLVLDDRDHAVLHAAMTGATLTARTAPGLW